MKDRLVRIEADYFVHGVFLTPDNKIKFATNIEPAARLIIQDFIEDMTWEQLLETCDKMKWKCELFNDPVDRR